MFRFNQTVVARDFVRDSGLRAVENCQFGFVQLPRVGFMPLPNLGFVLPPGNGFVPLATSQRNNTAIQLSKRGRTLLLNCPLLFLNNHADKGLLNYSHSLVLGTSLHLPENCLKDEVFVFPSPS